jgi:hypothetical protein
MLYVSEIPLIYLLGGEKMPQSFPREIVLGFIFPFVFKLIQGIALFSPKEEGLLRASFPTRRLHGLPCDTVGISKF